MKVVQPLSSELALLLDWQETMDILREALTHLFDDEDIDREPLNDQDIDREP
jgi:hypothetical protein